MKKIAILTVILLTSGSTAWSIGKKQPAIEIGRFEKAVFLSIRHNCSRTINAALATAD